MPLDVAGRHMFERMQVIDVAQVYELWNEYAAAVNDKDLERWLDLWVDQAIQMPPGAPYRIGKADIRRGMQSLFASGVRRVVVQPEEVRILGELAYTHGAYEFEMASGRGDEARRYSVKFLDILEKQIDGSWRIAIDCHNYSTPLE
jgi:uncharacterized protein (TIGR02246 family)